MDSGSGSLQSSSGADEEYDSHHHHHHQQQQPPPQLFPPPPPLFFLNNNNIPSPPPPSLISSQHFHNNVYQNHFNTNFYDLPSNYNLQTPNFNNNNLDSSFLNNPTSSLRSQPTPSAADGSTQIPTRPSSSSGVLHPKATTKKRTRASRRAPTTVLTTDTTNFRAMVQEFTGIPSPPFTASGSSYSSRRFDLFGSMNLEASGSGLGSGSGLYPSRSKVQLFSSLCNENATVGIEDQNVSNLQQQQQQGQAGIFSFQSLSEGNHLDQHQQPPPPHVHGSSQQLLSAGLHNDETWRNNGGGTTATTTTTAATGNCKLNYTGSSSSNNLQLQRDKEILLGNIISSARGENTVDSWIYPSD